jgi:hypothetical protein
VSRDRSRERRRLAAECLTIARQTTDVVVRTSLVEMAQRWLELAERCEHDDCNEALRLRAVEAAIGQELQALFAPPHRLPHSLLALLMQLNAQRDID